MARGAQSITGPAAPVREVREPAVNWLAHCSDLHATPVRVRRLGDFAGKRLLGWLSWRLRRRHHHRPEPLEALADDLARLRPDHVVVTGDLTNVACDHEFPEALAWLERLGRPEDVSVVPGNHDAYVEVPVERTWRLWSEYLGCDGSPDAFPTLRVREPFAIVGLSSANATPPFFASGRLGAGQLGRLERCLDELADSSLCRVVLIHHPVTADAVSRRRALDDAAELRGVLARAGAELVLHGHGHRSLFSAVEGPRGPIPVVGVRSASDASDREDKRAQYHLYAVERADDPRRPFRITARIRGYDPAAGSFTAAGERVL